MPNEDVSIGFWLMSVDLRRINNQRVKLSDCCSFACARFCYCILYAMLSYMHEEMINSLRLSSELV